MASLDRLRLREVCSELSKRAIAATDLVSRWRFLDALADVMDPGDEFEGFPEGIGVASEGLPLLVRKSLNDRLKQKRKESNDELKKHSRDR
jgi:hypothetical protein